MKDFFEEPCVASGIDMSQEVRCPHCGEKIVIDFYDYCTRTDTVERDMGTEILYFVEVEGFLCPECVKKFSADGCISEYPVGIFNSIDIQLHKEK